MSARPFIMKSIFVGLSFALLAAAGCKENGIDKGLSIMASSAKTMCACKDWACAEAVRAKMDNALTSLTDDVGEPTEAQYTKLTKIEAEMTGCKNKIPRPDARTAESAESAESAE